MNSYNYTEVIANIVKFNWARNPIVNSCIDAAVESRVSGNDMSMQLACCHLMETVYTYAKGTCNC